MASVKHKNIIRYKESFVDEESGYLYIVLELAKGGDLESMIKMALQYKNYIKEEMIIEIFK